MTEIRTSGVAWHVHHDRLVEYCYDIEERRDYICRHKPISEQTVRLARLQFVKQPFGDQQAWQAYEQAAEQTQQVWRAYRQAAEQAWQAAEQAWQAYEQAWQAAEQAWQAAAQVWQAAAQVWLNSIPLDVLDTVHREECPNCPWDGYTLFPLAQV